MRKLLTPDECQGKVVESASDEWDFFVIHFTDGSSLLLQSEPDGENDSNIYYRTHCDIADVGLDVLSNLRDHDIITEAEFSAEFDRRRASDAVRSKSERYKKFLALQQEFAPEAANTQPTSLNFG